MQLRGGVVHVHVPVSLPPGLRTSLTCHSDSCSHLPALSVPRLTDPVCSFHNTSAFYSHRRVHERVHTFLLPLSQLSADTLTLPYVCHVFTMLPLDAVHACTLTHFPSSFFAVRTEHVFFLTLMFSSVMCAAYSYANSHKVFVA